MGEMYEYFEDFPEENPANYVNGNFDPKGADALRAAKSKLSQEQASLDAEIQSIIQKSRPSDGGKKQ
jgi:hypothetical protein